MSWSLSATGTRAGVIRQLDKCGIYGKPETEEQAAFEKARGILKDLILNHGYECGAADADAPKAETVFKASASGHGRQITNLGLSYEIVFVR